MIARLARELRNREYGAMKWKTVNHPDEYQAWQSNITRQEWKQVFMMTAVMPCYIVLPGKLILIFESSFQ